MMLKWDRRAGLIVLATALVGTGFVFATVLMLRSAVPGPDERFTEFYLGTDDGNSALPETDVAVDQPVIMHVTIGNHEGTLVRYQVNAYLDGDLIFEGPVQELADHEVTTVPVVIVVREAGVREVVFELLTGDKPAPYRTLRWWYAAHK
jgi:uncharacterized membrane protein